MGTVRGPGASTRNSVSAATPRARQSTKPSGSNAAGRSNADVLKKLQRELSEAVRDLEEQEAHTSNEIRGLRRVQRAEGRKIPHFQAKAPKPKEAGDDGGASEFQDNAFNSERPSSGNVACELPQLVPTDCGLAASIAGAKESIRAQLKGAARLNDAARKASLRRLQVQWHPDKNRDDPALATAVFQFIQAEKARLGL